MSPAESDLKNNHNISEWKGHSDTETFLACFDVWGLRKSLERVIGMFAFAVWDNKEKVIILGRDRAGEKPLYYLTKEGLIAYASELKPLVESIEDSKEMNINAFNHYLGNGYIPREESIYLNINKIMKLPKPKNINIERYIGGLSQFRKVENPIKLSANESALGASPKAVKAYERDKNKFFKYPESDSDSLREAIAQKFDIDPKRIVCGSGSDQIFDFICKLFLKQGDEVIVTEFGFIMHRIYASLHGGKIILAKEKNFKASVFSLF